MSIMLKEESNKSSFSLNMDLEHLLDVLPDLIHIMDVDHNIIKVNKAMAEHLNVSKDDLVGLKCYELIHGTDEPPIFCPNKELLDDMHSHSNEFPIECLEGDFIVSVSPIFNDDGQLTGSIHVAREITERKKLEKSDRFLASIVESSSDAIIGKDLNGKITSWNSAAEKMYGYSMDEILGKSVLILFPADLSNDLNYILKIIKRGESVQNYDTVRLKKDGGLIDVSLHISPIYDLNGIITGASTITHDITARKRVEEQLKKSEEKFREVFNNANDAMFLHKMDGNNPGNFLEVNDAACESLGYTKHELMNMNPMDIDSKESIAQIPTVMENLLKNHKTTFEAVQITKKGELLPVEFNTHLFKIQGENYILSIARDIRERKNAENALKKSEIKYRTIFNNIQDIFYQTDNNGKIIEISPSIERYSGYKPSELIGKPVESVYLNPQDRDDLIKQIQEKGEVVDYEIVLKTKDNALLYVSTNAHLLYDSSNQPIGIEGSLRDITERKNIELQLKNSLIEKEMLLKEIHHRVKNNLMIISSLLNLQSRYIKDEESKNIFKESQNRAKSMALIHERLYRSTDLKKIDFGDYIRTLADDLYHTYVMDTHLIHINVYVDDLMLDINTSIPLGLIVNELVTNSLKHAFPQGESGEIDIKFNLHDDKYQLEVKDNGIGFPKDIDYKNTESLGLRLVTSLTEQIDGDIEFTTGSGTAFKINFTEKKFGEN
jgi:PAS domain S-box-containing protein